MHAERSLLERLLEGPATGDSLARASGQTRAAVWKRVEALRAAGVDIRASRGRGYALAGSLELLDAAVILSALPPPVRAGVSTLEVAWRVDSTNAELLRRPSPGAGVEVLLAEQQSQGRGRRGRGWASPLAANVYLSLSRCFDGGLARLGGLGLAVGVAAAEALHACGFEQVRLKWPNDLVVMSSSGMRKLGGVLVEGSGEYAGSARAVVGLGINRCMPSGVAARIGQPWTDLSQLDAASAAPGRNQLAAILLGHLLPALELFDREGLVPFLPRFGALDGLAGRTVQVHAGNGAVHTGAMAGVADDGALRVRLAEGERCFHAGEVSLRPAGDAV